VANETAAPEASLAGESAAHACAEQLLEAVPLLMREIRAEMRRSAPAALSVPSFRALIFAHTHPGGSLTELAQHLGVTLPTASVAVDKLAARGLLLTSRSNGGQRRRSLHLSAQGGRVIRRAMEHSIDALALRLQSLPARRLEAMQRDLQNLARLVAPSARQAGPGAART